LSILVDIACISLRVHHRRASASAAKLGLTMLYVN